MKSILYSILAVLAVVLLMSAFPPKAEAREQIRAVGSSTVYPFITVAAEKFGKKASFKTPVIESTGTGGGFKLFCAGIGANYPDIANASRAIKSSEVEKCAKNGITNIVEIKIGYDGLVVANSTKAKQFKLTKEQIFLALGKQVPQNGKLVDNPYQKWSDIDSSLPAQKIEVYGPPPTSGTRDSFAELVLEEACKDLPEFKSAFPDKKSRKKQCHLIREDGKYIDAGENDNLIVNKLAANENALGIFGYSFLEQNEDKVHGSIIEGAEPSFENISSGKYPVSRPLFVYFKGEHVGVIPGIAEFVKELTSESSMGEEGYLAMKGLVPLAEAEKQEVLKNAEKVK